MLQASGKKLEECEGECEVETGRRIGADLVVSGELLRFGTQYKLNMKLHDTRSGELLAGAVASGGVADDLDRDLRPAVGRLLAPLMQNRLSDQRAAANRSIEPAPPRPFSFSAHVSAGVGAATSSDGGITGVLTGSRTFTTPVVAAGADAGLNLGAFLLGPVLEYTYLTTVNNGSVNALWANAAVEVVAGTAGVSLLY